MRDEVDREVESDRRVTWILYILVFIVMAAVWCVGAFIFNANLAEYGKMMGLLAATLFVAGFAYRRFEPIRTSGHEICSEVSEIEKVLIDARAFMIDTKASMHEYLAEQAAWKTTERLDGRTDDDVEEEFNPESHDLVVKGIKCIGIADDYARGSSVPRNPELAEAWYRRAVPWYELAAEKDDSYAQEKLGDFYSEGKGVQRDDAKALYWWCKSANRGRASAQYGLGQRYYFGRDLFGRDVQRDLAEALFWFEIVIISHPASFVKLKREAASYRDDAAQKLTPADLVHAQTRIKKWLEDNLTKP